MAWCVWFEGTKNVYGLFPPEALKARFKVAEAGETLPEPEQSLLNPLPKPAETVKAPQSHLTAVDSAPVIPEPVEASQEPHPTQADIEPGAEKNDIESQVLSIQSLISTLLKRS